MTPLTSYLEEVAIFIKAKNHWGLIKNMYLNCDFTYGRDYQRRCFLIHLRLIVEQNLGAVVGPMQP